MLNPPSSRTVPSDRVSREMGPGWIVSTPPQGTTAPQGGMSHFMPGTEIPGPASLAPLRGASMIGSLLDPSEPAAPGFCPFALTHIVRPPAEFLETVAALLTPLALSCHLPRAGPEASPSA